MHTSVLAAKLFLPPPRPNAVLRAGLIARLNEGLYSLEAANRQLLTLHSGLSAATVANLVTDLIETQIVAETDLEQSQGGRPRAIEMGLPPTASAFVADMRQRLATAAALVDQQFPEQDQLSISPDGVPVLKRIPRRDVPQSAHVLERRLLARMPDRQLLDMVAAAGSWTNCTRHLGPPAGTEPKLDDAGADYTRLLFACGTNLGPTQAARHMREAVSARSLSYLNQRHVTSAKLNAAQADIVNVYHTLTLPRLWGRAQRCRRWHLTPAGRQPRPTRSRRTTALAVAELR